jgi:WD40 repeat protein
MNSMALSPDGRLLLYVGKTDFLIAEMESGKVLFRRTDPDANYDGAAWSLSGDRTAVGSKRNDSVAILNSNGRQLCEISPGASVAAFAFSPSGSHLALVGEQYLQLASSESGREIYRQALREPGEAVAFSHNGTRLACGGESGRIYVFTADKLRPLYELACASGIHCLAFSPDDSILVSGHGDSIIRTWEVETGRSRGEMVGHERAVRCVGFSPDGHTLLSAANDGAARLWSVEHCRAFGVLYRRPLAEPIKARHRPGLSSDVTSAVLPTPVNQIESQYRLSLSSDGKYLALGCANPQEACPDVFFWKIDPSTSK